jgi:hypothetical protein
MSRREILQGMELCKSVLDEPDGSPNVSKCSESASASASALGFAVAKVLII